MATSSVSLTGPELEDKITSLLRLGGAVVRSWKYWHCVFSIWVDCCSSFQAF